MLRSSLKSTSVVGSAQSIAVDVVMDEISRGFLADRPVSVGPSGRLLPTRLQAGEVAPVPRVSERRTVSRASGRNLKFRRCRRRVRRLGAQTGQEPRIRPVFTSKDSASTGRGSPTPAAPNIPPAGKRWRRPRPYCSSAVAPPPTQRPRRLPRRPARPGSRSPMRYPTKHDAARGRSMPPPCERVGRLVQAGNLIGDGQVGLPCNRVAHRSAGERLSHLGDRTNRRRPASRRCGTTSATGRPLTVTTKDSAGINRAGDRRLVHANGRSRARPRCAAPPVAG